LVNLVPAVCLQPYPKMRIDVVHISNTYGCVFVWIRFWDSLCLSTVVGIELSVR